MDKQNVVYTYTTEYYSVLKRKEILQYATTWMNLEDTMLSQIGNQKRQILYDSTYMMKYLEQSKIIKTENIMMAARGCMEGSMESYCLVMDNISV